MAAVRAYRLLLSPWLGSHCRFEPSCSAYALDALAVHGAAAGGWLAARRVLRCQPWCAGGCDPVPASGLRRAVVPVAVTHPLFNADPPATLPTATTATTE